MTPTPKELADGLREAGEGIFPRDWHFNSAGDGSGEYEMWQGRSGDMDCRFLGVIGTYNEAYLNEKRARFIAYCGTHANAIIEALEQAEEVSASLQLLLVQFEMMQKHMRQHLEPFQPLRSETDFINQIIEDLDGPTQRAVQSRARAALKGGE